ncbi:polyubiquitin 8-like [Acipenser oxyrinchus oxyrinchus]|uniref:Polyubiquitin 8-like n=1 Tax=Acipenser oxyrinchus oxyrinchus TaxID=40147 RepID=A0AAD8CGB5_ACIOX|nr:polyubiquitin 8-like [Acipenser oxyrinchus oxyrinchus]
METSNLNEEDECFSETGSPAKEDRTESRPQGVKSPMRVRLFSGKSHSIEVSPDDSVRHVKEDIGREVNQNPDTLQLVYDGSYLENGKKMKDCGITTEKPLTLIRSSSLINKQTEFPLFRVKLQFDGRDREMDVNPRHKVGKVKQEICEGMGKEVEKMLLLFEAPQTTNYVIVLEESKKIEEYDIKQGSVIRLVWKTDWETK